MKKWIIVVGLDTEVVQPTTSLNLSSRLNESDS